MSPNKVNGRKNNNGHRDSGVVELRAELARKIARHIRTPGEQTTAIPGLTLYHLTAPTACYAAEYKTGLAVIVQTTSKYTHFADAYKTRVASELPKM
jgi:hypothetical protein